MTNERDAIELMQYRLQGIQPVYTSGGHVLPMPTAMAMGFEMKRVKPVAAPAIETAGVAS